MKKAANILLGLCLVSSTLALDLQKPAYIGYQDSIGQYSFGYSAPGSARSEVRESDGKTRGSYSYVDPNGVIQSAEYTADAENGFRISATNLPQHVDDTPEVKAAREAHLEALRLAYEREEQGQQEFGQGSEPPISGQSEFGQSETGQPDSGQGSGQASGQFGFGQPGLGQPIFGKPGSVQPVFGQPIFGQPGIGQPVFGQPVFGQPDFGQVDQFGDGVVIDAKIGKTEAKRQRQNVKEIPPKKIVAQVHIVSGLSEALQSPEVKAARRAYIQASLAPRMKADDEKIKAARRAYVQAVSAARAKAEAEKTNYIIRDIITKVSSSLGSVLEAKVTDENGVVTEYPIPTRYSQHQGSVSGSFLKTQDLSQSSDFAPDSATLIMKNESYPSERFMGPTNLKDKQSTPDVKSQLYQVAVPSHKPLVVPSGSTPLKYASIMGTPMQQASFAVQCFITRADQLGNLVEVN